MNISVLVGDATAHALIDTGSTLSHTNKEYVKRNPISVIQQSTEIGLAQAEVHLAVKDSAKQE